MKEFKTSIGIASPITRVWEILTDVGHWTSWNTTIEKVVGDCALGSTVTIYTKLSPKQAFAVKVAEFDAPNRMVWTGGMPLGLFRGTRVYRLTSNGAKQTEFEMHEQFTGLLAPLISMSIPNLQPSFEEFANCLKQKAEGATK